MQQTATAAFNAAAVEAMRVRKQPGAWNGQKGARVATAALGAAMTDRATNEIRDDDDEDNGKREMIENTIGGLLAGRLVHGSLDKLKGKNKGKQDDREKERDGGERERRRQAPRDSGRRHSPSPRSSRDSVRRHSPPPSRDSGRRYS